MSNNKKINFDDIFMFSLRVDDSFFFSSRDFVPLCYTYLYRYIYVLYLAGWFRLDGKR